MVLLRKIKRLLGIGGQSEEDGAAGETSVTVERERGADEEPDASSEAAVKGTDTVEEGDAETRTAADEEAAGTETAASADADAAEEEGGEEPVSTDTDASGSTEAIVDEGGATDESTVKAEPSEAAGPESEDVTTDVDDADTADAGDTAAEGETGGAASAAEEEREDAEAAEVEEETEDETAETAGEEEAGEDVPVETIRGIGPAYAERLADMGIDSVADLAAADPAEVAEETAVSESRVTRWIDRAAEYEP